MVLDGERAGRSSSPVWVLDPSPRATGERTARPLSPNSLPPLRRAEPRPDGPYEFDASFDSQDMAGQTYCAGDSGIPYASLTDCTDSTSARSRACTSRDLPSSMAASIPRNPSERIRPTVNERESRIFADDVFALRRMGGGLHAHCEHCLRQLHQEVDVASREAGRVLEAERRGRSTGSIGSSGLGFRLPQAASIEARGRATEDSNL